MLRRTAITLFNTALLARPICMKQCGGKRVETSSEEEAKKKHEAKLSALTHPEAAAIMQRMLTTDAEYKKQMFTRIFNLTHEQLTDYLINRNRPSLYAITQRAENFKLLTDSFPESQRKSLRKALSPDIETVLLLLEPMNSRNQRRLLNFIGLKRLLKLNDKELALSPQSFELAFYCINESLKFVLKRVNHDYLHTMREHAMKKIPEQTIAAAAAYS